MSNSSAIWAIDIGQCSLKALRCRLWVEDPEKLEATDFDYIEYPAILSQPGADQQALVADALTTFLSRHSMSGDRVAIAVPGKNGVARFVKLPPIETKKIPNLINYEARQQIPFPLQDVTWDFQEMAGGIEEEGFALEMEVGLFGMKRELAIRALKPFDKARIDVDIIQLAPVALYNFAVFDQMPELPSPEEYDPEKPPQSTVLASIGTDTVELVITNGYRMWQRSLSIGGSQFTKALVKGLKLTFDEAEQTKRTVVDFADRKAAYKAMKPAFTELVNELQRSIGFFANVDRTAEIGRVVPLGNAMRLPGLQSFLAQNLDHPVVELKHFRNLAGDGVLNAPRFRANQHSFAVCYGLALQGLGCSALATNLLPRQVLRQRVVRAKRPWVAAATTAVLFGLSMDVYGHWRAYRSVEPEQFRQAMIAADNVERFVNSQRTEYEAVLKAHHSIIKEGDALVGNADRRLAWVELLKALNECLPTDSSDAQPDDIWRRNELHIEEINCQWYDDLEAWYTTQRIAHKLEELEKDFAGARVVMARRGRGAGGGASGVPSGESSSDPPKGPGWVISIKAYHFHNHRSQSVQGYQFVRDTLIRNLRDKRVQMSGIDGSVDTVSMVDLGISHVVMASESKQYTKEKVRELREPAEEEDPEVVVLPRFDFEVQFAWRERELLAHDAGSRASDNESGPIGTSGRLSPAVRRPR